MQQRSNSSNGFGRPAYVGYIARTPNTRPSQKADVYADGQRKLAQQLNRPVRSIVLLLKNHNYRKDPTLTQEQRFLAGLLADLQEQQ